MVDYDKIAMRLEDELERAEAEGDAEEVKAIKQELKELRWEARDQAAWEQEGVDRGWY